MKHDFRKTIVQVEVLSNAEDGPVTEDLFDCLSEILVDCSVGVSIVSVKKLGLTAMKKECEKQGTDFVFFTGGDS